MNLVDCLRKAGYGDTEIDLILKRNSTLMEESGKAENDSFRDLAGIMENELHDNLSSMRDQLGIEAFVEEDAPSPPTTPILEELGVKPLPEAEVEDITKQRESEEYFQTKGEALPESQFESVEQLNETLEGDYAILSAENPNATVVSEEDNAKLTDAALTWLDSKGLTPTPVAGRFGATENSFLVPGMTRDQATEFAQRFEQHSVAMGDELVLKSGRSHIATESPAASAGADFTQDNQTVIKMADGTFATIKGDYNFGKEFDGPASDEFQQARIQQDLDQEVSAINDEGLSKKVTAELAGFDTDKKVKSTRGKAQQAFVNQLDDGATLNSALTNMRAKMGRDLRVTDLPKQMTEETKQQLVDMVNNKARLTESRNALADKVFQTKNETEAMLDEMFGKAISLDTVSNVEKALQRLDSEVTIELHDGDVAYKKATIDGKGRAQWDPDTKTIHINKARSGNKEVFHEAAHVVFTKILSKQPDKLIEWADSIRTTLDQGTEQEQALSKQLSEFANKYQQAHAKAAGDVTLEQLRAEEFFAEMVGLLADNKAVLTSKTKKGIVQSIREILQRLFGTDVSNINTVDDVIDLMNSIATGLQGGDLGDLDGNVDGGGKRLSLDDNLSIPKETVTSKNGIMQAVELANRSALPTNLAFKTELDKQFKENVLPKLKKQYGDKLNPQSYNELSQQYLADAFLAEALVALEAYPDAIGWYDSILGQAMNVIETLHPEIQKDAEMERAFKMALAITSNGTKVDKNFEEAESQYSSFKNTGKFIEKGIGQQGGAKKTTFEIINKLLSRGVTLGELDVFLKTKMKAGNLRLTKSQAQALGYGDKAIDLAKGENVDTEVFGAMLFGPKIGNGFYMNLNGEYEQLTVDLWFMRTLGRLTGALRTPDPVKIKGSTTKLENAINDVKADRELARILNKLIPRFRSMKPAELANAIQKKATKKDSRKVFQSNKLLDEVRLAGNNLAKNIDGENDVPKNGSQRAFIRKFMADVQERLSSEHGISITMADLQAAIWYPEKVLYNSFQNNRNYKEERQKYMEDEGAPDYLNAAIKLARSKNISNEQINNAINRYSTSQSGSGQSQQDGVGSVQGGNIGRNGNGLGQENQEERVNQVRNSIFAAKLGKESPKFIESTPVSGKRFSIDGTTNPSEITEMVGHPDNRVVKSIKPIPPIDQISINTEIKDRINLDSESQIVDLPVDISEIDTVMTELNNNGSATYIVGGGVRDVLLGGSPKDMDIEVHGIDFDDLLSVLSQYGQAKEIRSGTSEGFTGIISFVPEGGTNMPEPYEFSVPRTETSTGKGKADFEIVAGAQVDKKKAFERRENTINAVGYNPITKELYNPFNGLNDLDSKEMNKVSNAFEEDPSRVVRAMQFQSRFGLKPSEELYDTMRTMTEDGLLDNVPAELWGKNFDKMMTKGKDFTQLFDFLRKTKIGERFFPDLMELANTKQDTRWHPEGNVEEHTSQVMQKAFEIAERDGIYGDDRAVLLYSALLHDVAKPETTETQSDGSITSRGHEAAGVAKAQKFLESIRAKKDVINRVLPVVKEHLAHATIHSVVDIKGKKSSYRKLQNRLEKGNFKGRLQDLLWLMEADMLGRNNTQSEAPASLFESYWLKDQLGDKKPIAFIQGRDLIKLGLKPGKEFADYIRKAQIMQDNQIFENKEQAQHWLKERVVKGDIKEFKTPEQKSTKSVEETGMPENYEPSGVGPKRKVDGNITPGKNLGKRYSMDPNQPNIGEDANPNMTEDGQGNYVFYHYSDKKLDKIDPKKFGTNPITSKSESADLTGAKPSFYYTNDQFAESGTGSNQHQVKIPKDKVYDATKDILGFYDEAKKQFQKVRGNVAFNPNAQIAWITKVAQENGFDMAIARWGTDPKKSNYLRAQSTMEHTPEATNSKYEVNGAENAPSELTPADEKLDDVYEAISEYRSKQGNYDKLYKLRMMAFYSFEDKYSPFPDQQSITDTINESDLPKKLKDRYNNTIANVGKRLSLDNTTINKIKQVLRNVPNVSNNQLASMLNARGISVTPQDIQAIRNQVAREKVTTKRTTKSPPKPKVEGTMDMGLAEDGFIALKNEDVDLITSRLDLKTKPVDEKTVAKLMNEARPYMSTNREGFTREDPIVHEILRENGSIMNLDAKMIAVGRAMDKLRQSVITLSGQVDIAKRNGNRTERNRYTKLHHQAQQKLEDYIDAYKKIGSVAGRILVFRKLMLKGEAYTTKSIMEQMLNAKADVPLTAAEKAYAKKLADEMAGLQGELDQLHKGNIVRSETAMRILGKKEFNKLNRKIQKGKGRKGIMRVADALTNLKKMIKNAC